MNKSTDIYKVKNPNSKTNKGGYKIDHKRDYPCHCKNCDKDFRGVSSSKAFHLALFFILYKYSYILIKGNRNEF